MVLLGVNSVYHESSAAIVIDGQVVAAAEEERFNRTKHGKAARVENPHQMPVQAIRYCLECAGVTACDIDAVGFSFDPALRKQRWQYDPLSERGDWGDHDGEKLFQAGLEQVPAAVAEALNCDITGRFHWVEHHMCHAASAYYPSGFDDAAILVVDGIGEHAASTFASGEGATIRPIADIGYPHSIGFLWEKLSRYLGFSEYDACKVMGLAAYGDAGKARDALACFAKLNGCLYTLEADILEFRRKSFTELEKCLGARRLAGEGLTSRHADIAAALQCYTDRIMLTLTQKLYRVRPSECLCLAGGVALNCQSNWRLKEEGPFDNIFIPSAPHDAGTAIGAALWLGRRLGCSVPTGLASPYLGPAFNDADIEQALDHYRLNGQKVPDIALRSAQLLANGKIVGWFQGRMEFGPRALGNRSLLADPRCPESRERMNARVKRRESFRPFAPSVLDSRCGEWFHVGKQSPAYRYMLFACPVQDDKADLIPAVLHSDRTARVQIVAKDDNPQFYSLIENFANITNVPMVLNTSFIDSEPIVCSPGDAVQTFVKSKIDALALGDYLVTAPDS